MPNPIGKRQIHLDFHTSGLIQGVAAKFNPDAFADTLKQAHVDSITLFSRGHHGMLYYDSSLFPEFVHPHLCDRQLLEHQAEACHKRGIDVNLYTTVCWDKRITDLHPEWVCIDENGTLMDYKGAGYFDAGFYKNLCVNTAYRDYLKEQFGEVIRKIPAEGVWFDAAFIVECCCPTCIRKMQALGLNPADAGDRTRFSIITYQDFVEDLSAFVRETNPDFNIFYNKGHVGVHEKNVRDAYTYYAFESLPGGEWGYMDFPLCAKYNRNFGKECLGMTGRFHTEWGDIHSFRNQDALDFECYSMLANGCKCIIGDQPAPSCVLNPYTYRQIGALYADIEQKEPWCDGAQPVVEAALFTEEEFMDKAGAGVIPKATEGAARLLMELSVQFDVVDSDSDISQYRLLVLPDQIRVSEKLRKKLQSFTAQGGKILASYHSGLAINEERFVYNPGVEYLGEAPFCPDFIIPQGHIGEGMPPSEHVMYMRAALTKTSGEAEVLLPAVEPVFNRTWEHFHSHLYAPSSGKTSYPAVISNGNGIYFAHPVFAQYQHNATPWCKKLAQNAVSMLLPERLLVHDGPSSLITNIMAQESQSRWVVHLLYYIPQRKCATLDIVDEVIPLYRLSLRITVPHQVKEVWLVPENKPLLFSQAGGTLTLTVPKIIGHRMLSIQFRNDPVVMAGE